MMFGSSSFEIPLLKDFPDHFNLPWVSDSPLVYLLKDIQFGQDFEL